MYLKRAEHSENPLQGQCIVLQVRFGSLFIAFGIAPSAHLALTRKALYKLDEEGVNCWRIVYLQAGEVL